MPSYHLTYFHGRGLGEVSRLIFAATNTAFTETRLPIAFNPGAAPTWPEFEALRATGALPYGQVPTLVVDGAAPIAQSKAIERYLAGALGLAGASPLEAARLDSVCEEIADVKSKFTAAKGDAEKKAAFFATDAPKMFGFIDAQLAAVGGAGVTLAEVYLFHLITHWAGEDKAAFEAAATPGVKAAVAKVAANAGVAAWEAARAERKEIF